MIMYFQKEFKMAKSSMTSGKAGAEVFFKLSWSGKLISFRKLDSKKFSQTLVLQ